MSLRARTKADQQPVAAQSPAVPGPVRPKSVLSLGMKEDRTTRRLFFTTLTVIVLWLAAVVGFASTSGFASDAPRTSAERALRVYEYEIQGKKMTPEKWADYITLLTTSGQYRRAQQTIDRTLRVVDDQKSLIMLEQARLDFARKDYEKAVKTADATIAQAKKDLAQANKDEAARGFKKDQLRLAQEEKAVLLKAEAFQAAGAPKKAIDAFTAYLEFQPTAANVYIERADMRAAVGDNKGAEEDYRKALQFTPEDVRALEGLQKIGAES